MAEAALYKFEYNEVVEALIKQQNLHEGIWQLYVEFGLGASNIASGENVLSPAAIVPIVKIGLRKVDKESTLAVDASRVNPS